MDRSMDPESNGWEGHDPAEQDIRRIVLSYAVRAPSPHNTQPWIVEFDGTHRIHLFIDQEHLLPASDPESRQACISHGAFIENLDLASRNFGYRTDIDLFPGGWPGSTLDFEKPLATMELEKDDAVERDALFAQILERETNRRVYRDRSVSWEQITELSMANESNFVATGFITERSTCEIFAGYIVRAMEIDVSGEDRVTETLRYFRFSGEEGEECRDGYGIAQCGITGISRKLADKSLISRERAESPCSLFGREAVKLTRRQAVSAATFGWISTKGNTHTDQVKAGRTYERVCLKAAEMGLAVQPFSQVLCEYPDMEETRGELRDYMGISPTHTLQMIFRAGYADRATHTKRRPVADFIRAMT